MPEQTWMILTFNLFNFECVVEVNDLVNELSPSISIFHLNSIPELKVSMEYAKLLQLKDPI